MLNSARITAKVLQQSITPDGKLISTFELEYPRFIHAEFLTHRLFSLNSASSRAIKMSEMIRMIAEDPAHPIHWGADQAGMQSDFELSPKEIIDSRVDWRRAAEFMGYIAGRMKARKVHKQVGNRLLEPFSHMKTILTTTELENFMASRDHKDDQPEIQALAKAMKVALEGSQSPMELSEGEYHVPYIYRERVSKGRLLYVLENDEVTLEEALKLSASACDQVSYRVLNMNMNRASAIYEKLVGGKPIHASPFEHQATPIVSFKGKTWPKGITHRDRDGNYWSGNFKGWLQERHLLGDF